MDEKGEAIVEKVPGPAKLNSMLTRRQFIVDGLDCSRCQRPVQVINIQLAHDSIAPYTGIDQRGDARHQMIELVAEDADFGLVQQWPVAWNDGVEVQLK